MHHERSSSSYGYQSERQESQINSSNGKQPKYSYTGRQGFDSSFEINRHNSQLSFSGACNANIHSDYGPDNFQYDSFSGQEAEYSNHYPPPVPPPHSVSLSVLKRDNSYDSIDSLSNRRGIISDRTPSPLRHAMNDVMSSLDNMQSSTILGNSLLKENSFQDSEGWNNSPSNQAPGTQYSDTKFVQRPGMLRNPSSFSNLSDLSNSEFENRKFKSPALDSAPFDPNSFDASSMSPARQRTYDVSISRTNSFNSTNSESVARAGTHKSHSSVNTNSHSLFSEDNVQTDISNSSTSSAGSTTQIQQKAYFKMEGVPGLSNSVSHSAETPVALPNVRLQHKSQLSFPQKSMTVKKAGGFLKNLFSAVGNHSYADQLKGQRISNIERAGSSLSIQASVGKGLGNTFSNTSAIAWNDPNPANSAVTASRHGETDQWIEIHRNVHRTNTLTKNEKERRKARPQVDGIRTLEPIDSLSRIAGSETADGGYTRKDELHLEFHNFSAVENNIANLNSWPFVTPGEFARCHIIQKFSDSLDQLRAAFDFCSTKLKWEALVELDEHQEDDIGSLARVMQSRRGSCLDIANSFKQMCDALSIRCDVVTGYLKGPGEVWHNPGIPRPNHYWNALIVNGLWRMVDASLASPGFPTRDVYSKCDKRSPEYFYFLTPPSELVYTHVPYNMEDEHIVPSLSHEVLIALPLAGPSAFKYKLELQDFSTSLTRMQGLDVAELTVAVPLDVEIFAEVQAGTFPAGSSHMLLNTSDRLKTPALSQAFWENSRRFYRIKSVLPPSHNQGALNVYVGPRGTSPSIIKNTFSLAYSVPMIQKDENPPLNFVIRHSTSHTDNQDIYINEPQCCNLVYGQSYVFSVRQQPCKKSNKFEGKIKMAIQTPQGRIVKLNKADCSGKSSVVWEGQVRCMDVGTWRGLTLSDSGNAWSVYAEWHCA